MPSEAEISEPTVCCILLTRDRPEMAKRAVATFRAQTYENACLLMFNTGCDMPGLSSLGRPSTRKVVHWHRPEYAGKTIGELRNLAIQAEHEWWGFKSDIIAHFDDDDLSHPNRLAEQVALLQSSGADAVGYSDLLFWDTRPGQFCAAWLYTRSSRFNVPGTTLMYWRKTWEAKPFPDLPSPSNPFGEDTVWQSGLKVEAVSCFCETAGIAPPHGPRMIAGVHGSNTQSENYRSIGVAHEFKRVPEWDAYCRERMRL